VSPPHRARSDSRGFTLTEITVVIVLAGVVTLGLVGFYLNSQAMWMDASTQALAQRDATSILEFMRQRGHGAASAVWDASNHKVTFYDDRCHQELDSFAWNATDSLVYHGIGRTTRPTDPWLRPL
jgi:prepilin-type N-terminal cleavage/methylation domain-containing protein